MRDRGVAMYHVAIRERAKEATPNQPSAFGGVVLIGPTNACSHLQKGTIICLLSDTYAVHVGNIGNRNRLQK
jgi:hypothetical protein